MKTKENRTVVPNHNPNLMAVKLLYNEKHGEHGLRFHPIVAWAVETCFEEDSNGDRWKYEDYSSPIVFGIDLHNADAIWNTKTEKWWGDYHASGKGEESLGDHLVETFEGRKKYREIRQKRMSAKSK